MSKRIAVLCTDAFESSDITELFVNWMKPLNASFESFLIYEHDLYPADDSLDTFDLFIVTDDPWILKFVGFLKKLIANGKNILGICWGHQIMARCMGGEVIKSPKGPEFGCKLFDFTNPCHTEDQRTLRLYLTHSDIVSKVPEGLKVIGENEHCIQAMSNFSNLLTFQGHPEFTLPVVIDLLDQHERAHPSWSETRKLVEEEVRTIAPENERTLAIVKEFFHL